MKNQIRNLLLGVIATSSFSFLGFLPLKTQAATETLVSCVAGRFYIQVRHNTSNDNYTYIAYEGGDRSNPSLVLRNGSKTERRAAYIYTFENGDYTYVVSQKSKDYGGQIYLNVYESGETILSKQCYPDGE